MEGVQWLADQGCKVINMSLGGGDRSQAEEALYNQITQDGTLIVVASGNDSAKQLSFPGRYQTVLSVGAVDVEQPTRVVLEHRCAARHRRARRRQPLVVPAGSGARRVRVGGRHNYPALPMEFAGATSAAGINAPLVNCGLGATPAACGTHAPGFVALMQRGSVSFATKVASAQAAGAAAAIVYNNAANGPGNFNGTLGTTTNGGTPWIPAVSLSQTDGEALAAAAPATATAFNIAMAWNYDSGTSMATPHVAGVAALVFGKNPKLKPHDVEAILEKTATDLGVPNYDTTFGYGLVNAQAALAATP